MSLLYSRHTPFGFIDLATATDEDKFYGEEVALDDPELEAAVLGRAEELRGLFAASVNIQTHGGDSQSQALEMAEVLSNA